MGGSRVGRVPFELLLPEGLLNEGLAVAARDLMVLEPALVAAQPLLDMHGRSIGAGIGVGRERVGLQHDPGIKMDHAFGAKAESLLADGDVPGKSAVEIL